jgi:hypothetical protein
VLTLAIISIDMTRDAMISICGDFPTLAEKYLYEWLKSSVLNFSSIDNSFWRKNATCWMHLLGINIDVPQR